MDFFTADLHLAHRKIIEYTKRPFANVTEMDNEIIYRWNSVVTDEDTVWLLGDVTFSPRTEDHDYYFNQLRGDIRLIRGNHDPSSVAKHPRWNKFVRDMYTMVLPPEQGQEYGQTIIMCHYPIEVWNGMHYGAWHLHGHTHGTLDSAPLKRLDVGVDVHDFTPISLDQVREIMSTRTHETFHNDRQTS